MSRGNVRRFVIDATGASFDGTIYALKDATVPYKVGAVGAGENQSFDLTQIGGLNNGDNIQARITSTQGASNTDPTVVTYVKSANYEARYLVSGTAVNPNITLQSIEKI